MTWLSPHIPAWLEWMLVLAAGVLFGIVCKAAFAPVKFWSWRTFQMVIIAGAGTIAVAWLSAPGYNPLQPAAGLENQIFIGAAVASLTAVILTALSIAKQ